MVYRVVSCDIWERCSVQDEENGPEYWALRHTIHKLWWWRGRVIYWVWLTSVWELSLKLLECRGMNARNSLGGRGKLFGQYCQKLQKDPTKEEEKCCHCSKRRECHLQYVTKRSRCCILIDRLTERGCWGCFLGDGRGVCGERLFQGFGQKWKVITGTVVFQRIFVKWWLFQERFDDGSLQITWYNASGKRCVDDVRDGRQEDVEVFIKKCGWNGIKFTSLGGCTVDYFLDKFINNRLKS